MAELLTSEQMKAVEQTGMQSGSTTGLELMERAGQGVVTAVFEAWPELAHPPENLGNKETARQAVILCGPGNNGGDGFVIARLLKQAGWSVAVFLYGDADKLPVDAQKNWWRWTELGAVHDLGDTGAMAAVIEVVSESATVLIVDALFGTGLTRALPHGLNRILNALANETGRSELRMVAVDVPSGRCADTGKALAADAFRADLTVTFHRAKPGHYLNAPERDCGRLVVADIGLQHVPDMQGKTSQLVERPVVPGKCAGHKYAHGHALVLSGKAGHTGAARLAARGALRIGAGLVTIGCPKDALAEHAAQLNAIMLRRIADAIGLAKTLRDPRITALCLGPGLGLSQASRDLVGAALRSGRACVLDADALSVFAEDPARLFALTHKQTVLTPHAGEFARLFPDIAAKLETPAGNGAPYSKLDATRDAAARAGCVVLFKGADTVIADPDGHVFLHAAAYDRQAPWLATAGSGDVLAGFVTGLLARGVPPVAAAVSATWLHVECARFFGPGLIAEDLPETLPQVLRGLAT